MKLKKYHSILIVKKPNWANFSHDCQEYWACVQRLGGHVGHVYFAFLSLIVGYRLNSNCGW